MLADPEGLLADLAAQMGAHLEGLADLLGGLKVALVGHLVDSVVRLAAQKVE